MDMMPPLTSGGAKTPEFLDPFPYAQPSRQAAKGKAKRKPQAPSRNPIYPPQQDNAPKRRYTPRKYLPKNGPIYLNPAPRRPIGLRLRGQGLDVRPRAYNWFGGKGGADTAVRVTKTYAELAQLAPPQAPARHRKASESASTKKAKRRKAARKPSARSRGSLEERMARLQGDLTSLAEKMRKRLP